MKTAGKLCKINFKIFRKKCLWKSVGQKTIISDKKGGFVMQEPMYIKHTETKSTMGDRIVLYYFTNEKRSYELHNERIYGIGIDMYTQLPGERTLKERKIVDNIFKSKTEAEKFINVLCRATVTPTTLEDIIADNIIA